MAVRWRRTLVRAGALRMLLLGAGCAFLGVTGYQALMMSVTARQFPAQPQSADALRKLSESELGDAFAAAQFAFVRDPLDAASVSQLARISEIRGDLESALRLKLIAGDMRPRSLSIQAEALAILLQRRDFDGALYRLDGLIRARPNQSRALFAVVADIATDAEGRKLVAARLAGAAPWRQQFLAATISAGRPEIAGQVLTELRGLGAAVSADELRLLIEHYMNSGEIDAAYAVWLSSLGADELDRVRLVYDGDFDKDVRSLRFDWTVAPVEGFSYRRFPRNTASMDMALQLDFLDVPGGFANLSQILRLRPGRYRIRGEVRFEDYRSPAGAVFRVHCLQNGKLSRLDETGALPQSAQWVGFERIFSVPVSGCQDQLLRLESLADAKTAGTTTGLMAVDNITIDSLPALAP